MERVLERCSKKLISIFEYDSRQLFDVERTPPPRAVLHGAICV